jgi:hypothetical protein
MSTRKNPKRNVTTRSQTGPYPNQEDRDKLAAAEDTRAPKPKVMEFEADVISRNYTDYSAKVPKGRKIASKELHKKALYDEKGLEYTDETLFACTEANAFRREATKNRKPVVNTSSCDEEPENDQQYTGKDDHPKNDKNDQSASAEKNNQQDDQQDQSMEGIE